MDVRPLALGFVVLAAGSFAACSGESPETNPEIADAGPPDATFTDAPSDAPSDAANDAPDSGGCGAPINLDAPTGDLAGQCGACGAPGGPIGGGPGYPRAVPLSAATVTVSTREELLSALAAATCGDIVYVDDAAEIDLTGDAEIPIPAGVTLASGRGSASAGGGLIFTSKHGTSPLFSMLDRARVTGLRIRGPQQEIGDSNYDPVTGIPISMGIFVRLVEAEIDNCELFGWSHTPVLVSASRAHVHHSSIHHNRRYGFGYGVLVSGASWALIEANAFDANRHSIAGNGDPASGYEARFNRVLDTGNGHAFDMHGKLVAGSDIPVAGDAIRIHHNTFLLTTERAALIRGRPATGAWIEHNSLAHTNGISYAVAQEQDWGNFVMDNCIPAAAPICP